MSLRKDARGGRLSEKPLRLRAGLACGFALLISGCGLGVQRAAYEKDREETRKEVGAIRSQLLAHTQILANHGRSLNEFKLRLRDAASSAEEKFKELKAKPAREQGAPQPAPKKASAGKPAGGSEARVNTRYVRRAYRGLPLNFAGGYRAPRGASYPYRLAPGTRVAVLSADSRGFTRVQVKSGRWAGETMWVRTRWLIRRAPSLSRGGS